MHALSHEAVALSRALALSSTKCPAGNLSAVGVAAALLLCAALGFVAFQLASLSTVEVGKET